MVDWFVFVQWPEEILPNHKKDALEIMDKVDETKSTQVEIPQDSELKILFKDPLEQIPKMDTLNSSSAAIISGNDGDNLNAKLQTLVDRYVTDLAKSLNQTKDDLEGIVHPLLVRLKKDEFWKMDQRSQRDDLLDETRDFLHSDVKMIVKTSVFTKALDSLMRELDLIKDVSIDDRMVPVDYHIADTDLQHKFDLNKLVEKEKSVHIAPYFCFVQSSGMGKTKLMYEFAKLTKMKDENSMKEDFRCDLILSGDTLLEKDVHQSSVFDCALDLLSFVTDTNEKASTVANAIYEHLERKLDTNRDLLGDLKKTRVVFFDEAQVFLKTHKEFEAFLFRCIQTWLRKERPDISVTGVFSGTSSAILNYNIQTDLKTGKRCSCTGQSSLLAHLLLSSYSTAGKLPNHSSGILS